jgi:hypothetical protein
MRSWLPVAKLLNELVAPRVIRLTAVVEFQMAPPVECGWLLTAVVFIHCAMYVSVLSQVVDA